MTKKQLQLTPVQAVLLKGKVKFIMKSPDYNVLNFG